MGKDWMGAHPPMIDSNPRSKPNEASGQADGGVNWRGPNNSNVLGPNPDAKVPGAPNLPNTIAGKG